MKLGVQGSVDAEGVQEVQGEAVSLADGAAAAGDASSCGNKKAIRRVQLLKALAKNFKSFKSHAKHVNYVGSQMAWVGLSTWIRQFIVAGSIFPTSCAQDEGKPFGCRWD